MDEGELERQNRHPDWKRILSRIGLILLVLSLSGCGVSTFFTLNSHSSKPRPNPFNGNLLTATPTMQPTTTGTSQPAPTATSQLPPSPTPTIGTTPTSVPATPTAPSAALIVNPTNLVTTLCTDDGTGHWTCQVTLTSNSQNDVNWFASSILGVATFTPPNGILLPGQSQPIMISSIPCQNDTFTFSGAGVTPASATWNCTQPTSPTAGPVGVARVPASTPTSAKGGNQIVSDTTMSNIKMVTAWPPMTKGQSVEVTISLIATQYLKTQLTATIKDEKTANTSSSTIMPVGTPDVAIKDVFGSGYKVDGLAQLSGSAFEITPNVANPQTLDQPVVTFYWSVLPNTIGPQTLVVNMIGQWRSPSGKELDFPIAHTRLAIAVNDTNGTDIAPFFTTGQISLSEITVGFIGTVLNVPWLYDMVQKARKKKKSGQGPSNTPPRSQSTSQKKRRRR